MALTPSSAFGDLLKRFRESTHLTQEELAERARLSVEGVSALERGIRRAPRKQTVQLLTEALALSPHDAALLMTTARQGNKPLFSASPSSEQEASASPQTAQPPLAIGGFLGARPDGPLVAREHEMLRLLPIVEAVASGAGRMILLSGEPGIGKTRLAQEFSLRLRERGFLVATGRCYEPQQAVPYYPFLETLHTVHTAAPAALRSAIPQRWPDLLLLLPTSTLPTSSAFFAAGPSEQQRLFWQITDFLRALAGQRPLAVLLDDLHWADSASLALLQHLARQTRTSSILLLGTYRENDMPRQHALRSLLRELGREHLLDHLAMRPFDTEGTAALVRTTIGQHDISAEFAAFLQESTEGNPFFTVELLRALVERGDIYRHNGAWERRELAEIEVPESIRAAIDERLARLDPVVQIILREASVLGQSYAFDDLRDMLNRPEDQLETALEDALATGLVHEIGADQYAFHHNLTQQALYRALSARRRRRLHHAAGEMLERMPEHARERRAPELAWHFLQGDDPPRALPYALRAGDHAEALFAHTEAERHYRTALSLAHQLGEVAREAEILERLGAVLLTAGRHDEALAVLDSAANLAAAHGDLQALAAIAALIGRVHTDRGTPEEGLNRIVPLLDQLESGGPSRGLAALYTSLAYLYVVRGQYDRLLAAAARAVELAHTVGDDRILAAATGRYGAGLLALGRTEEALPELETAAQLAQAVGDLNTLTRALGNLAVQYHYVGLLTKCRSALDRAIAVAERMGDPSQFIWLMCNRGQAALYTGEWPLAHADFARAASMSQQIGIAWVAATVLIGQGLLCLAEGDWDTAGAHLRDSVSLAERRGDVQLLRHAQHGLAQLDLLTGNAASARDRILPLLDRSTLEEADVNFLLPLLAWAYLDLGDGARAVECAARAIERMRAENHRVDLTDALRIQALVALRQDHWEAATSALDEAISLAHLMPYPFAEARALHVFSELHQRTGNSSAARQRLEDALAIFRRLGAARDTAHAKHDLALLVGATTRVN